MEVTNENFEAILPSLFDTIKRSQLISIDCEFSGINCEKNESGTMEEIYKDMIKETDEFRIIQFGLTVFYVPDVVVVADDTAAHASELKESDETSTFLKYRSYNFYINANGGHDTIRCQNQSMRFLAENGFDFTKLFLNGIDFINENEAKVLKKKLIDRNATRIARISKRDDSRDQEIERILNSKNIMPTIYEDVDNFLKHNKDECIVVAKNCNPIELQCVIQMLRKQFKNTIHLSHINFSPFNNNKGIVVRRQLSANDELELIGKFTEKYNRDYDARIGFLKVIQAISEQKVLMIGHNMFLDIMYIMRQFFNLPKEYNSFKQTVNSTFPYLIDTKYMCFYNKKFKQIFGGQTSLMEVYQAVKKCDLLPEITCESDEYEYSLDKHKLHEAGFDSYITGLIFFALLKYSGIEPNNVKSDLSLIRSKYLNKIYVTHRSPQATFINLNDYKVSKRKNT